MITQFLPRIQRVFSGWEDLGQNYLTASNAWLEERNIDHRSVEDVEDNIDVLRESVGRGVSFDEPLLRNPIAPPRPSRARELLHMLGLAIDWAIEFRVPLIILAFAIGVVIVLAHSFLSTAFAKRDLIGTWAGELVEDGAIKLQEIQPAAVANRRAIRSNGNPSHAVVPRPAASRGGRGGICVGTGVRMVGQGPRFWHLTCKKISPGYECERKAYRLSIDNGGMRYKSISGRVEHTMRKVSADYALPSGSVR